MSMFPYNCTVCGGAYSRCALRNNKDKAHAGCKGGQFCWETEIIVSIDGKTYNDCRYDGRGSAITPNGRRIPTKDADVKCQSCVLGHKPSIIDNIREDPSIQELLKEARDYYFIEGKSNRAENKLLLAVELGSEVAIWELIKYYGNNNMLGRLNNLRQKLIQGSLDELIMFTEFFLEGTNCYYWDNYHVITKQIVKRFDEHISYNNIDTLLELKRYFDDSDMIRQCFYDNDPDFSEIRDMKDKITKSIITYIDTESDIDALLKVKAYFDDDAETDTDETDDEESDNDETDDDETYESDDEEESDETDDEESLTIGDRIRRRIKQIKDEKKQDESA